MHAYPTTVVPVIMIILGAHSIEFVHDDLTRLLRDLNKGAEIVRGVGRLPTR